MLWDATEQVQHGADGIANRQPTQSASWLQKYKLALQLHGNPMRQSNHCVL